MAKTLLEKLESVENAIEAVLSSQSYKMNGREMTRADLGMLEARAERLEVKIRKYGPQYKIDENTKPRRGPRVRYAVPR